MVCSNCGSEVAAGSPTCGRCGAPQPAGVAPGAQAHGYQQQQNPAPGGGWGPAPTYGGGQAAQSSGFNFDLTRWQRAEQITGAASLLLIISLFLHWFTISATVNSGITGGSISVGVSGTKAHGYLWLVFFVALAVLAVLVLQAGFAQFPISLPFSVPMLLTGLTGLNLLLVLLAFVFKPSNEGLTGISIGWAFGAFVALIFAIAAFVPLVLPATRPQSR